MGDAVPMDGFCLKLSSGHFWHFGYPVSKVFLISKEGNSHRLALKKCQNSRPDPFSIACMPNCRAPSSLRKVPLVDAYLHHEYVKREGLAKTV